MIHSKNDIETPTTLSGQNGQNKNTAVLPNENLELVSSWGGASHGISHVYRPSTVERLQEIFNLARKFGRTIGFRGGGKSYGDAAMNDENILVDLRRMNRILDWNPENGCIRVEPGVTLAQLWQYVLEDGWWPMVVTGTMETTLGGCAAMNVHGKNGWQVGPIGNHILEFELMIPSGEIICCSPEQNSDIFYAAIGGFGMLGCFTSISLQMKRIYSGLLAVETETRSNLEEMFSYFEENLAGSDYIVGWMDAFAKGSSLGRGDVHKANYIPPGMDPNPSQTLRLDYQHLPNTIMGLVPKSIMWRFMRPFFNNFGTRLLNMSKFWAGRLGGAKIYQQPHAVFHFLLDYVPDWKKSYGPGGLIQYQPFIPKEYAADALRDILKLCQKRGLPNYLTVFKRHRPDKFMMTHGLDGYSLAMDFRITKRNRERIVKLTRELDEIVGSANGRFYFAKDSTLRPSTAEAYLGRETIERFHELKKRCDPEGILETNLWRRIFG